MPKNLSGRKLGIIHAALITTRAVQKYIDEIIPEVEVVHWVDDTIQNTNFACEPGIDPQEELREIRPGGAVAAGVRGGSDSTGLLDVQPGGGVSPGR